MTDPTISHALSEITAEQANATEQTLERCHQFLDYMVTYLDVTI